MTSYYRTGRFEIHPSLRAVRDNGAAIEVGSRAFDLLIALVESRDRILSKRELLQKGWPGLVVEENTLQVQISLLRKFLGQQAIATVPSRGYRFVMPVTVEGTTTPTPALSLSPAEASATSLPTPSTRFVGRAAALADCLRLVGASGLLTLTGPGGSGKTRLAIEVARQLLARGTAVWFVDLSFVQEPEQFVAAVAATLDLRERPVSTLHEVLMQQLRRTRGVLVLDNCEQVVEAVATVAAELAPLRAALQIVATSRQPLGVAGEQIYPVQSLSLPAAGDADAVRASEAVQLFTDRTRLIVPGFEVDAANAAAVADVCERLDGIPLAIELAAARMKLLSVRQLGERLDQRFRLLVGGSRALPRQQTLRASVQWSYELLGADEQRTLRALAVFEAGCTLEAATAVCTAGDEYEALERLTGLYDKSLLVVDAAPGRDPRYRMLQTVRQYALEALAKAGEEAAARTLHLRHFVQLAQRLAPQIQSPLDGEAMQRLRGEQENLLAALAWARTSAEGAPFALRLAGSLWPYWLATAQLALGADFTRAALDAAPPAADPSPAEESEQALARLGLGNIAFYRGLYREALDLARQSLAHAGRIDEPGLVAFGLKLLAGAHHALGEDGPALANYQATLDLATQIGDLPLQASALNNLAEVHRGLGDLGSAKASYLRAIEIGRAAGDLDKVAFVLCNLTRLLATSGAPDDAVAALHDSHAIAAPAGLRRVGDELIDIAAGLASLRGDAAVAARLHGAAMARMRESGSKREPVDEAFMAPLVAAARLSLGEPAFEAMRAAGDALAYETAMAEAGAWLAAARR